MNHRRVAAEVAAELINAPPEMYAAAAGYALTAAVMAPRYRLSVTITLGLVGGAVARQLALALRQAEADRAELRAAVAAITGGDGGADAVRP